MAPVALGDGLSSPSYGLMLLRVLMALAGVCLLAYLVLRYVGRRVQAGSGGPGPLRLVARLHLEPRRAVYVVEAAGRCFLLGSGESGPPAMLAELDPAILQRVASEGARVSFRTLLGGIRGGASTSRAPSAAAEREAKTTSSGEEGR
jgi:flagellar biogenesis protein FliO